MVYRHAVVASFCIYAQRDEDAAIKGGCPTASFQVTSGFKF